MEEHQRVGRCMKKDLAKREKEIDELENQQELSSNDTENLISEEVHWIIKVFKKIFCYR